MKGKKTGGRTRGTPNRMTRDARETFRLVFEALAPELEDWIRTAASRSPAKAAELLLRLAEHFVPRLARNEVTTNSDGPLVVVVRSYARPEHQKGSLDSDAASASDELALHLPT
jgi:hypothetical protein